MTMKKYIYLTLLSVFAFLSCDEKDIKISKLPDVAQMFIETHFSGVAIYRAEKEFNPKSYSATLANGVDIEFTKDGTWVSVDCKMSLMPESIVSLLPKGIEEYLIKEFQESKIVEIDKELGGYKVSINSSNNEFYFSSKGEFIRVDVD